MDGKKKKTLSESESQNNSSTSLAENYVRGIPDYDYEIGTIEFIRWKARDLSETTNNDSTSSFEAFGGTGHSLRAASKKKSKK